MGRVWGPGSGPGREADPCIPSSIYVPSLEYIDLMETTQYMNEEELHVLADTYDSVYLHPVWMGTVGRGWWPSWDSPFPHPYHSGGSS